MRRTSDDDELERYKAELDRFLDERRTDKAFAKADERERKRKAGELIDEMCEFFSGELGFPRDELPELISQHLPPRLRDLGFTADELKSEVERFLQSG